MKMQNGKCNVRQFLFGMSSDVSAIKVCIIVSPELCSERDYVITHSVRSMYVCGILVYVLQN